MQVRTAGQRGGPSAGPGWGQRSWGGRCTPAAARLGQSPGRGGEERIGLPGTGLMGSRLAFGFYNFQPSVSCLLKSCQEMLTLNYRGKKTTNKDNENH